MEDFLRRLFDQFTAWFHTLTNFLEDNPRFSFFAGCTLVMVVIILVAMLVADWRSISIVVRSLYLLAIVVLGLLGWYIGRCADKSASRTFRGSRDVSQEQ